MVDATNTNANNTRATSKKIKDSAAARSKSDDISVANVLVPPTIATGMAAGPPSNAAQAHSGSPSNASQAHSGNLPSSTQAPSGSPFNPANDGHAFKTTVPNGARVSDTTLDTSESRREQAPAASLVNLPRAKHAVAAAGTEEEEAEEDNSPGRIGTGQPLIPAQKAKLNVFAVPTQTPSGAVIYQESTPMLPAAESAAGQTPEKFFLTEGDLVYAIGSVTNHNSVGFAPFLDENIRKLRSLLPLTIFNRKWQQRAMSYHLDCCHRSDESSSDKEKSGGYKGFAFVQEWTQTYAQWTQNHRAFCKTLHDVYKIKKFSKLLATHKNNCDDITEEFGFMVVFRYDMEVRNNTFSHRITEEDVKNAIPDISQRKESVVEQCYNVSRNFGELEWEENLYAPGLSHCNHDPLTGYVKATKTSYNHNGGYQNNAMIHNQISQGHWVN
ncbi:hypothetical protein PGT21_036830 [Puccinia graminis f. sp. tritici]|uniref:Uncharacterized protein n=1 Tax=Puccinia graminis f. sp. tritici TaxID=56615 RepID=A0A5B0Q0Y5_PUCGR|nr:hypothetical protein PGT21_036830 [Puccinia graminis f. sp. tritici]